MREITPPPPPEMQPWQPDVVAGRSRNKNRSEEREREPDKGNNQWIA